MDRCDGCGSLWFDALELDCVLASKGGAKAIDLKASGGTASPSPKTAHKCPVDHSDLIDMSDLRQAHIKSQCCTVCGGIQLDAGELADLANFSLKERFAHLLNRMKN